MTGKLSGICDLQSQRLPTVCGVEGFTPLLYMLHPTRGFPPSMGGRHSHGWEATPMGDPIHLMDAFSTTNGPAIHGRRPCS